ncbi:MAG TPA: hypothetical protein VFZ18_12335 [Longimicrobiaceae bacterium]
MRQVLTLAAAGAALAAFVAPAPAAAQDVQYETVTKVELPGAAGTAMRIAARLGGGSTETVETTYIKGRKMRSDGDDFSTIIDLDAGRITLLDHGAKSYSSFTFEEMAQRAGEAAAAAQDRREVNGQGAEAEIEFRFSVDAANERQRIAGYDAQRFFLTMEAEAEAAPEGQTEKEEAGTLVVLTDMWTSRDIPVLQARSAFDDPSARQVAEAGAAITEGFAAAFADDPRLKVAFEQSMSEARKIEGMAVRTVTSFVSVAPGVAFDRAQVIAPKAAGPSLAQQAGRAAVGGLMGRLGRRAAQAEPAAAAEPTQATILSVTSEIRNVKEGAVDASLFEVPAGYRPAEQ